MVAFQRTFSCVDILWHNLRARRVNVRFVRVLGRGKRVFEDSVPLIARFYSQSGRVNARFVRVLGRGTRIFKDAVRLIARFYSWSEYISHLNAKLIIPTLEMEQRALHSHTFRSHFSLQVIRIFKPSYAFLSLARIRLHPQGSIFTAPSCVFRRISAKPSAKAVTVKYTRRVT